jgi:hypothetical protein
MLIKSYWFFFSSQKYRKLNKKSVFYYLCSNIYTYKMRVFLFSIAVYIYEIQIYISFEINDLRLITPVFVCGLFPSFKFGWSQFCISQSNFVFYERLLAFMLL